MTAKLIPVSMVAMPSSLEQTNQVCVVAIVVDDEAGIDSEPSHIRIFDIDGVRMAAQSAIGLEEHHVVARPEKVRAGESGDPRAHDGDSTTLHRVHGQLICAPVWATHHFHNSCRRSGVSERRVDRSR